MIMHTSISGACLSTLPLIMGKQGTVDNVLCIKITQILCYCEWRNVTSLLNSISSDNSEVLRD